MLPNTKPVYLIDSSIYVFRAWFTLPDTIVDVDNNPVNAVYGFADFLLRIIESEKPAYLACMFDESLATSVRNEIYPAYKANRESAPEDLKYQFKLCRQLVAAAGITDLGSGSLEADDIIGMFSQFYRERGYKNIILTADKDLTQFIGEHDIWWDYARNVKLGSKQIEKKFGVTPEQIADLLALTGDKVDNIPGVPGVGVKTAAGLLRKWKNLDGLLNNIPQIGSMKIRGAKRIQQLIEEHAEQVRMARQLTGLISDESVSLETNIKRSKPVSMQPLMDLFDQLGFAHERRRRWTLALES